ncbi:MAG TPA: ribosome assembly cofactor RimP [Mariprofundaceae bacterium]|nr:ribosome assembly cofactor RimP [Mariprofundaceae bacterium]
MESRIRALLQPIADELGVDVLKVSIGGGEHSQLLRVIVDRVGGVDSDVLERISRGLALQLDADDPISGRYRLEVSSPGLDWELQDAADFRRYQGEWIKVFLIEGGSIEGRNLGPCEVSGVEGFKLGIEAAKAKDNEERSYAMREVAKVIRAINWKEVSRRKK